MHSSKLRKQHWDTLFFIYLIPWRRHCIKSKRTSCKHLQYCSTTQTCKIQFIQFKLRLQTILEKENRQNIEDCNLIFIIFCLSLTMFSVYTVSAFELSLSFLHVFHIFCLCLLHFLCICPCLFVGPFCPFLCPCPCLFFCHIFWLCLSLVLSRSLRQRKFGLQREANRY